MSKEYNRQMQYIYKHPPKKYTQRTCLQCEKTFKARVYGPREYDRRCPRCLDYSSRILKSACSPEGNPDYDNPEDQANW